MSAEKQYKYPSINNFNKKSVFAGEWIAEEKIHGANMSFHVDCKLGSIRVARRNDFLEPEDKFYNYKQILDKHEKNIINLCNDIKSNHTGLFETIIIYGEIFGGNPPVQKDIYYSDNYEFIPFDIAVASANKKSWLEWEHSRDLFKKHEFLIIPLIARDSFEKISSLSPEFNSLIPSLFQKDFDKTNIAEGYVIRPVKNTFDAYNRRILFKIKNPKFGEIKIKTNKSPNTSDTNTSDTNLLSIVENMKDYITENRLNNVKSKLLENNLNNSMLLAGKLTSDILNDYSINNNLSRDSYTKKIKELLHKECLMFVMSR